MRIETMYQSTSKQKKRKKNRRPLFDSQFHLCLSPSLPTSSSFFFVVKDSSFPECFAAFCSTKQTFSFTCVLYVCVCVCVNYFLPLQQFFHLSSSPSSLFAFPVFLIRWFIYLLGPRSPIVIIILHTYIHTLSEKHQKPSENEISTTDNDDDDDDDQTSGKIHLCFLFLFVFSYFLFLLFSSKTHFYFE